MIPYGLDDAHTLARALLDFGRDVAATVPTATFDLPAFRLTVATDSGVYAGLARRALVNDVRLAPAREFHITVADYATHPEMPRGMWTGESYGRQALHEGLRPAGFEGNLDIDLRSMQFFDPGVGEGIEVMLKPGDYPPWNESFPLRNFFHWAYQSIGWRLVHAATLGIDGAGVLLAGAGGAGKSGTTLAGIIGGLDSVGDDYVAIEVANGHVTAYPVMRLMKQDAKGLARLGLDPKARGLGEPNWQDKYEFDFEDLGAGRRAARIGLKAILLPRVTHASHTSLRRAKASEVMTALAPNNLQQLPDGWKEGLAFIGALARALPAYYLDLSEDPAEIARTIGALIKEGAA